jgi:hypothetical protein
VRHKDRFVGFNVSMKAIVEYCISIHQVGARVASQQFNATPLNYSRIRHERLNGALRLARDVLASVSSSAQIRRAIASFSFCFNPHQSFSRWAKLAEPC